MDNNCFSRLNGYEVKDAKARNKQVLNSHFYYYIDGVNGSDDNDGLTEATAFKTANKLLSKSNENNFDVRGRFISPGEYIVDANLFIGCAYHIDSTVSGVTLNFTDPAGVGEIVFYGTHYNFKHITLKTSGHFRFETCAVGMSDVTIVAPYVTLMGCYIDSTTTITIPKMLIYGTTGRIRNLISTHKKANDGCLIIQRGSNIRFYGTMTFSDATEIPGSILMSIINSCVWMELDSISLTNFTNGIKAVTSLVLLPRDIYSTIASNTTGTPLLTGTGKSSAIFINDTMYTGGAYTTGS